MSAAGKRKVENPAADRKRIRAGDSVYFEIVEFLEDEAMLLDDFELLAWVDLLADDLVYRVPVRVTRLR
ncbi:MAG: hypothetical protein ACREQY_08975, partial [Candidatus Binatia bacterium]